MIIFEIIETIDDAAFDRLFDESLAAMDAGSYPWGLHHGVSTYDEKKAHVRSVFDKTLKDGIVFHVIENDYTLMLNGGTVSNGILSWYIGLIGANQSGSKSYLYNAEYKAARDAFWPSAGITDWRVETMGQGTAMHDHIVSAVQAGAITDAFSSESIDSVVTITNLNFTTQG